MAAHDGEVGGLHARAEAGQRHALAGLEAGAVGRHREEPVRLREGRDRARALGQGQGHEPVRPRRQRGHHEFHAAELGTQPLRQGRGDGGLLARRQPGHRPDQRHHEFVEGEHRRGREARQHHDRLALRHREAEGLAGLERDAVDQDPGFAEARQDAVRDIARALRGAPRQHDEVAGREALADRRLEGRLVVRHDAARQSRAAILDDGGGHDRPVRIVDRAGPQGLARRHQLVAGRQHRHARAPHHRNAREPAGGEHADLAGGDEARAAQHRLAERHVGAGAADELAGPRRPDELDRGGAVMLEELRMLHHHHRVGAARDDAAGGDRGRGAGRDRERRGGAAGQDLGIEGEAHRARLAGARAVGGPDREAVDEGAVEGRHVDRRGDVLGQDPAEGLRQPHGLRRQARMRHRRAEPRQRVLAREYGEELFLPGDRREAVEEGGVGHDRALAHGARIFTRAVRIKGADPVTGAGSRPGSRRDSPPAPAEPGRPLVPAGAGRGQARRRRAA
ncbi:hypothetical protein AEGHOMDF_3453 [Methylobacterium soli]|nr:hypothetical protein AEGHOMDF_3453 [Methylobacterium soli]